jgi:subtilisin family serine protease
MADRFIILPRAGFRARSTEAQQILSAFPSVASTGPSAPHRLEAFGVDVTVRDVTAETGPKLVEMSPEAVARINAPDSPVRAVREVFYPLPLPVDVAPVATAAPLAPAALHTFTVEVLDGNTAAPISGANVNAFSDFANRIGAGGLTGANGKVSLTVSAAMLERVTASPTAGAGYWSGYRRNVAASGNIQIQVPPLSLPFVDSVRHFFPATNFVPSTGVKVGVIDTGCGPHTDFNVVHGRNTVTGEARSDYQDGHYHGTHVAGLIGARASATSNSADGVAPWVPLVSYRVFGAGQPGASNYAILKAMIDAADEGCDIINLSLGGGPHNDIVEEAIVDARNQGMLVVIAAGNNYRSAVSYPAAYPGATAVSALGYEGTYPAGSGEEWQAVRPPSSTQDAREFIAHFSNVGAQVAVTAPGVGAISTLPNNRFGVLSGTSMAAPVIAGAAACLLSQNAPIHGMPRNRARSDTIAQLLQTNCRQRGFGLFFEGYGLPQSPMV